ncbi:GDP-mannose 4,6-dehydratase [Patescibacteria group bacterium]|nr:GDP-mannose 4,6-dehydratase [Patescibacteria group bacterium]
MERKRAFITGVTGQDGSYLAELLLAKGYEVHGLVRRTSTFNRHNIEHLLHLQGLTPTDEKRFHLHYGDMTDMHSLLSILQKVVPHEIYNLAAQSHVRVSFDIPFYTAFSDAIGVLSLLEAARIVSPNAKIYQASTSELYSGDKRETPQNENTHFRPRSPYGVAKLYGAEIARIYREGYGMYVCNGILFNHESPRRGENFVTRKVVMGAIEVKQGRREFLPLGNLDARRDWGYAPEYMEAAWKMLQQKKPDDYVIATGETHSIRELAELAFHLVGITLTWKGRGRQERGVDAATGKTIVTIDPLYFRPNEVEHLCGDARKARRVLKWRPKTTFKELIRLMVDAELEHFEHHTSHSSMVLS